MPRRKPRCRPDQVVKAVARAAKATRTASPPEAAVLRVLKACGGGEQALRDAVRYGDVRTGITDERGGRRYYVPRDVDPGARRVFERGRRTLKGWRRRPRRR